MSDKAQSLSSLDSLAALRSGLENGDALARLQAVELCRKLQTQLETPGERLMKLVWAEPTHHWVIYAAQDLGIFKFLSENDESPKTISQIAEQAKAEPFLVGRIMRQMASMHTVAEVAPDTFAHSEFSRYLLTYSADSTLKFMRWFQRVEATAPEFLAQNSYKSPVDPKKSPFAWAYSLGDVTWFEYLSQEPNHGPQFAAMMQAESEGKPTWSDASLYPVKEKLSNVEDPNSALVVDIGGGTGHDLTWFRKNHPEMKGRLVLQDLPYITDNVKIEGIEPMAHSFYDEQPIKGAQVYFMHQIMHDYDDETCIKILRAIVPAMKPGFSKILINDLVLPDQGAHWFTTTLDLQLMLTMSARERTRAQFIELVGKVGHGLRVEKVWTPTAVGMLDSLIECVIDP